MTLELTKKEAQIILRSISNSVPPKEDEMITIMLYTRITKKLEENA